MEGRTVLPLAWRKQERPSSERPRSWTAVERETSREPGRVLPQVLAEQLSNTFIIS